jgi:hypothetical protein
MPGGPAPPQNAPGTSESVTAPFFRFIITRRHTRAERVRPAAGSLAAPVVSSLVVSEVDGWAGAVHRSDNGSGSEGSSPSGSVHVHRKPGLKPRARFFLRRPHAQGTLPTLLEANGVINPYSHDSTARASRRAACTQRLPINAATSAAPAISSRPRCCVSHTCGLKSRASASNSPCAP